MLYAKGVLNNMDKKKSKPLCKCMKCQFYDKENDACPTKDVKECSKKGIEECDNFLVKDKLVMF